jgi:hypothetical protein
MMCSIALLPPSSSAPPQHKAILGLNDIQSQPTRNYQHAASSGRPNGTPSMLSLMQYTWWQLGMIGDGGVPVEEDHGGLSFHRLHSK